jgi:3-deoxy-D-manno-octulosonic-acid transferase
MNTLNKILNSVSFHLFLLLYRFFVMPFSLIFAFLLLVPFNKKIRLGLDLRRKSSEKIRGSRVESDPRRKSIWIHASSGEFEYAKPLIREIKNRAPESIIVVTFFSPSFVKQISSFPGVDLALPLPLDLPGPTRDFIKKIRPSVLLVARTDLWPELLLQAKELGVPAVLFSATFRPLTGVRWIFKPYYKMLFNLFSEILVVSTDDRLNIENSKTKTPVIELGDTRYDQVLFRLAHPKPIHQEWFHPSKIPVLVAGSTWPEDERILFSGMEDFLKKGQIRLVVVPHEPNESHLQNIESELKSRKLTVTRYTSLMGNPQLPSNLISQVLLVDQIGILAELYLSGNLAFVGGSFKSKVHSVMEPLGAKLLTVVGPFHKNNREAIQFQTISTELNLAAVTAVRDSEQLKKYLHKALSSLDSLKLTRNQIYNEVSDRTGATIKVLNSLTKSGVRL